MVDINKLRGISSPPTLTPSQEEEKKAKIIERGLERARPNLADREKEVAKKQLMEKIGSKISNDKELTASDLEIDTLAFAVAESLQTMESETCPVNEYFEWIDEAQDVIRNMTDGNITDDDIDKREDFLSDLDQRETEMRVYMALYARCSSPAAKERLAFLQTKLAKLMELRSAVKAATKSREEAEKFQEVKEEEKKRAEQYAAELEYRKRNPEDNSLFTDAEYKAALAMSQSLIALAAAQQLSEEEKLRKQRYEEYLAQRMRDLQLQRDLALKAHTTTLNSMHNLRNIQMSMARYQEMINLVKVANTTARHGYESDEERMRREICGAVLEYRIRGKEVPDRILYKLGVKSFVPDYSMSEEILNQGIKSQSKADVIKRINELTGRQSSSNRPQLQQNMQRFDSQRFIMLKKLREQNALTQ